MIKFTIKGRLPGMNEYIEACRSSPYEGARMKRVEQNRIEWIIRLTARGRKAREPVYVYYEYFEPNKKRDHDNVSSFAHKVIQDALVKQGVLSNDGWNSVNGYRDDFYVDKNEPRIEVFILESDEGGEDEQI